MSGSHGSRRAVTASTSGTEGPPADDLKLRARIPKPAQWGLVLVLASAVMLIPGAAEPHPLIKAAIAALGAALILSCPRTFRIAPSIAWLVAAAGSVLFVAALFSATPLSAIAGRYPRYEGVWVIAVYVGCLAAGARLRSWRGTAHTVTVAMSLIAIVVFAVSVIQQLGPSDGLRGGSLLGNASELGVWAAMAAVLLAPAALNGDRLAIAGATCATLAVALSASRGGLLGLLMGAAWLLFVSQTARRRLMIGGAAVAVVLISVLLPFSRGRLTGSDPIAESTIGGRLWLWHDTVALVQEHPFLGVGPSGFVDGIGATHGRDWAITVGAANPPDSPHNVLLQVLASGGLILAIVVAAIGVAVIVAVRRSWPAHKPILIAPVAAIIAYSVSLLTHFTSSATAPLAALLVGWVVAVPMVAGGEAADRGNGAGQSPASARDRRRALRRWTPVACMSVCALVLALAAMSELLVARAVAATGAGNLNSASTAWDQAHWLRPWDRDLWLREGHATRVAVEQGLLEPAACLNATSVASSDFPKSSEANADRAACLELNHDFPAAEQAITAGLASDPMNADLVILAGVIAAQSGDLVRAESLFLEAAELAPTSPQPWQNLAIVYERMGRGQDADEARRRAQDLTAK